MEDLDRVTTIERAWVAIAYGVLDVSGHEVTDSQFKLLVTPTLPGMPLALPEESANLWLRLVDGPVSDSELDADERELVHEMCKAGITTQEADHFARVSQVPPPWLVSPTHELVYALVQSVANEHDIPLFFVKGPVLNDQGLRERAHSGDVDVWVKPNRYRELAAAMEAWGWVGVPFDFTDLTYHSFTLRPSSWGCEIDVHFRFPGIGLDPETAFGELESHSTLYSFAGVESKAPATATHAVIHALHLIRPIPGNDVSDRSKNYAIEALSAAGDEVMGAAATFGSVGVLREVLSASFPDQELPSTGTEIPVDWAWRLEPNRARYHLAVLRSLPWKHRLGALRRILLPTDETARRSAARAGVAKATGMRAYLIRFGYGMKQLFGSRARK